MSSTNNYPYFLEKARLKLPVLFSNLYRNAGSRLATLLHTWVLFWTLSNSAILSDLVMVAFWANRKDPAGCYGLWLAQNVAITKFDNVKNNTPGRCQIMPYCWIGYNSSILSQSERPIGLLRPLWLVRTAATTGPNLTTWQNARMSRIAPHVGECTVEATSMSKCYYCHFALFSYHFVFLCALLLPVWFIWWVMSSRHAEWFQQCSRLISNREGKSNMAIHMPCWLM